MGIFDALTGKAAKDAAEKNRSNLEALKVEGLGYLDDGKKGALDSLTSAIASYDPVRALAAKYNAGGDMLLNALGLNGAGGNAAAVNAFQSSPGYDFKVNSALDALDRRAASRGMLASGNTTNDTLATVTGLADQDYGSWLDRLSGLTTLGANETNIGAAGAASGYSAMAPVYVNDANSRVGLASNVTGGINNANTQEANAKTAASGNILGLGMNLASLAVGGMGGFGGFGGAGGMSGGMGLGDPFKSSSLSRLY